MGYLRGLGASSPEQFSNLRCAGPEEDFGGHLHIRLRAKWREELNGEGVT